MALPLPQVIPNVGPGGRVVTSMRGANALAQDMLNSMIKGAEAEYAPWTNYANAASKLAYSQFVGPQAIASILSNPATRGMFSKDQYNALAGAFARQINNPALSLSSMPTPFNRSDGMLSHIMNTLSSIGEPSSPPPSSNALIPSAPSSPDNRYEYDQQGNNVMASPQEVERIALRGNNAFNQPLVSPSSPKGRGTSPTYDRLSREALPEGTYGAINPPAVIQAGEAGMKSQISQEAKNIADQWKKRQDEIRDNARASTNAINNIKRMRADYNQLNDIFEAGPFGGRLPAIRGAAQDFDLAANDLMISKLKSWQNQRVTNFDLQLAPTMKPGRYMNKEEFDHAANYEESFHRRQNEVPLFSLAAQRAGLTPAEADAIWVRYANEKPFYDNNKNKILYKNLDSWEDYLTPQSIQETFSPSYKKKMQKYHKNMYGGDRKEDTKIEEQFDKRMNEPGPAVRLLAHKMKLPKFESKQAFLDWYNRQPKVTRDAVKLYLKEKEEK